ncbi:MAG: hypothetical protein AAGI53_03330 [Planctomycetota bacterium]
MAWLHGNSGFTLTFTADLVPTPGTAATFGFGLAVAVRERRRRPTGV